MPDPLHHRPTIVPADATEVSPSVFEWMVPGARVILPSVSADPLKDSLDWWEAQREGLPQNEFNREYGVDFSVFAGKPVYPEYQERLHRSPVSLKYIPNRPILRGWDVPGPLACVWLQLWPLRRPSQSAFDDATYRLHILAEYFADTGIEAFGQQVTEVSRTQFPQATTFIDWADPAASGRLGETRRSAIEILRASCGIHLQPGPTTIVDRTEPVRRWLMKMLVAPVGDPPGALLVDPDCLRIHDGFKSGYHYEEVDPGSGRYKDLPAKNGYSHLMNALEYAVARASSGLPPSKESVEEERKLMDEPVGWAGRLR